ncbi:UNVERIFIED_ORG: hypothetical protein M2348_000043 [Sphingomonas sp. R1F5B]
MSLLESAAFLIETTGKARAGSGMTPVRWWLTEADWIVLAVEIAAAQVVGPSHPRQRRLLGLPFTIDRSGQPSRLITENGTAISLHGPPA